MDITALWTWQSIVAAAIAGVAYLPIFVMSFLHLRLNHSRAGYAFLVGVNVLIGTFLFSVSQAVAALAIDDEFWFRVVSRWFMNIPFAATLVVGLLVVSRRTAR